MTGTESLIHRLLGHEALVHVATLALILPFVLSGVAKAVHFEAAIAEVRTLTRLRPAALLAALTIIVQLGGSLLVLHAGRWAWLGAGLLAGFTVAATCMGHAWWKKSGDERTRDFNTFLEHVAIVGGLLLVAIAAAGVSRAP